MPKSNIHYSQRIFEEVAHEISSRNSPRVSPSELRQISVSIEILLNHEI